MLQSIGDFIAIFSEHFFMIFPSNLVQCMSKAIPNVLSYPLEKTYKWNEAVSPAAFVKYIEMVSMNEYMRL